MKYAGLVILPLFFVAMLLFVYMASLDAELVTVESLINDYELYRSTVSGIAG